MLANPVEVTAPKPPPVLLVNAYLPRLIKRTRRRVDFPHGQILERQSVRTSGYRNGQPLVIAGVRASGVPRVTQVDVSRALDPVITSSAEFCEL